MIHWSFKKIITSLMTVMGVGTLTSCYGMPAHYGTPAVFGYVSSSENYEKDGIKGIKVTVKDGDTVIGTAITDKDGYYSIDLPGTWYCESDSYTLEACDIDGSENGSYKSFTKEIFTDLDNQADIILEAE